MKGLYIVSHYIGPTILKYGNTDYIITLIGYKPLLVGYPYIILKIYLYIYMFNTIINPTTNRKVQLHSATGHKILNNYIKQVGGWGGFKSGTAALASTTSLAYGTGTLSGLRDASPEGMASAKKMEVGMAANKFGYRHNNLIDINYGDGRSGSIDNAAAKKKT